MRYPTSIERVSYRKLETVEPLFPVPLDAELPEVALRGMANVLPGLAAYFNRIPKPFVDGGYYARTLENRPLIGPSLLLSRYEDPTYQAMLPQWGASRQF